MLNRCNKSCYHWANYDGWTVTLDLNGNTLTATGDVTLSNGAINDTATGGQLTINTSGTATFDGTTLGAMVNVAADNIYLNGSHFKATSTFLKTGTDDNTSTGGNTFDENVIIENGGNGALLLGNGSSDTFLKDLDLNSKRGNISLAQNSNNNTIAGDLNVIVDTSFGGNVYLSVSSNSNLVVEGNTNISHINQSNSVHRIVLGDAGDVTLNQDLSITNISNTGYIIVADKTEAHVVIKGNTTVNNGQIGGGILQFINFGVDGDVTFDGDLTMTNVSTSFVSFIAFYDQGDSEIYFNGHINIQTGPGTGTYNSNPIFFGDTDGGQGYLADGKVISIVDTNGTKLDPKVEIRNFTQYGNTSHSLVTSENINITSSTWEGNLNIEAANVRLKNSTFQGTINLKKTNANTTTFLGGNIFSETTTLNNSGGGIWKFGQISTMDTYEGDLIIDSAYPIAFGSASGGGLRFGGASDQTLSSIGAAAPTIYHVELNKSAGDVTLNTPITVENSMTFTQGIVNTSEVNLLTLKDGATVSGASNSSYVDGPVEKIGEDDFIFPIGDRGYYRPIEISAPDAVSDAFQAIYFNSPPSNQNSKESGIGYVSQAEYWELLRNSGASNPTLTLGWEGETSGSIDDINDLVVIRYDDFEWKNLGGASRTGGTSSGTVENSVQLTNDFGFFALGSTSILSTLPIELIRFEAKPTRDQRVQLIWETASELNNDFFTLERSTDRENWEIVTEIEGAGTSSQVLAYDFMDQSPRAGTSYYRLKQTDFDGQYEYSNSISVTVLGAGGISIYPNPGQDVIHVGYEGLTRDQLSISNMYGQEVIDQVGITKNKNNFSLGTSHLPAGIYYIKIGTEVSRVAIQ